MTPEINRRSFIKTSVAATAAIAGLPALQARAGGAAGKAPAGGGLAQGKIGKLKVSRMLLGGNLLTHYTHSRDLRYVYNLAGTTTPTRRSWRRWRWPSSTASTRCRCTTRRTPMSVLKKIPQSRAARSSGSSAPRRPSSRAWQAYTAQVQELVDAGCEAIYLWGVRADPLVAQRPDRLDRQGGGSGEGARACLGRRLPRLEGGRGLREAQDAGRLLHQDLPPPQVSTAEAESSKADASSGYGARTRRGRSS